VTGSLELQVRGESLVLLPQRALYWPRRETLLVADMHLGKAATFRSAGLPVPGGTTLASLNRLDRAIVASAARRIVFLGDLLHAREGRAPGTLDLVRRWREGNPHLELILVRGNHDRHAGDPPDDLGMGCVDGPLPDPPFAFVHDPDREAPHYAIGGHIHPAVRLVGRGRQRERLPCFWFRESSAVLPAFGDFTGNAIVNPRRSDGLMVVVGESDVVRLEMEGG
jgi:uncharacterized protein